MKKYRVVESFLPGSLDAVYARFYDKGRMLPEGLLYLDSWLSKEGDQCFQLMETADYSLFEQWIENWQDLASFDVIELGQKPQRDAHSGN